MTAAPNFRTTRARRWDLLSLLGSFEIAPRYTAALHHGIRCHVYLGLDQPVSGNHGLRDKPLNFYPPVHGAVASVAGFVGALAVVVVAVVAAATNPVLIVRWIDPPFFRDVGENQVFLGGRCK